MIHMLDETIVVENMEIGHLNQVSILKNEKSYGEFAIYLIKNMAVMLVFRWVDGSIFHYLIWDPYWWKFGNRHKKPRLWIA